MKGDLRDRLAHRLLEDYLLVPRIIGRATRAAAAIGVPAAAIVGSDYDAALAPDLTPAGRIVVPRGGASVGRSAQALLATAVPLQLLTERMARERGVNPDPIRRDDPRYLRAAEVSSPTS